MTHQCIIRKSRSHWRLLSGLTLLGVLAFALGLILPAQAQSATPGYVFVWGWDYYGEGTVPAGLSGVTAIAAGQYHNLALKSDGTVVAWGANTYGESTVPAGLSSVTAISAGDLHSLALKSDGTVVAWGDNSAGQRTVPAGLSGVTAIAAGYYHNLALKSDGTVVAWGDNSAGQRTVPAGLSGVTAIAANYYHSLALKSDGTVVAWGCLDATYNTGQCVVPAGLSGVIAIAAGTYHSLALKRDGAVVGWGSNNQGQLDVPAGLSGVIAIAAGEYHNVALKSDGAIVLWKDNYYGQIGTMPTGLRNVTAIAASGLHTLVINRFNDFTPPTANPSQSPDVVANGWTDSSNVTVFWNWRDNTGGSGIDTTHCTTSNTSSGEGVRTLTATCQDKAGNVGSASYTVKVDLTPPAANPTQSPAANGAGWNNTNVTVTWNWTDPSPGSGTGSGVDAPNCTTSSTSGGEGVQTFTATCLDQVGHFTTASYTVKVDRGSPQITANVNPLASSFGWHNSAVAVSFTCADQGGGSGLATNTVGGNATFSSEGNYPAVTNTGTCVDNAGNVATAVTVGPFKIDLTKPTISAAATTQPNANGWYNSNVTVHFTCADALSGIAFCPGDEVLSSEGGAVVSTVQTGRDKAVNYSDPSNGVTVKLDKTAPVVTVIGVSDGATYTAGSVPTAGCTTSDALSGVATPATLNTSNGTPTGPNGATTVTATCSGATDLAGNSAAPTSVSYTVNAQINSSVSQQSVSAVYNATAQNCPSTGGSLPLHTVTPTLRNTTSAAFTGLFFRVKTVEYTTTQSGQPVLCNATSGNGGVNSTLTIPNNTLPGGDNQFNPGENLIPNFQIGLPVRAQYRFFVDLYSTSVTAAAANNQAESGEHYLGSLVYVFDEADQPVSAAHRLFLPLVNR